MRDDDRLAYFSNLHSDLEKNIESIVNDMRGVMEGRESQLKYWCERSAALQEECRQWRKKLPKAYAPTLGKLHFPLLREMLIASGHDDRYLLYCLEHGFPVSGPMNGGGVADHLPGGQFVHGKPAHGVCPRLDELRGKCSQMNKKTLAEARVYTCD